MSKTENIQNVDPEVLLYLQRVGGEAYGPRTQRAIWLQIYDRMAEACLSGPLSQGGLLPGENDLAGYFSVSRLTMRKALQKLQQEGQLQARKGVGIYARRARTRFAVHNDVAPFAIDDVPADQIETVTLELARSGASPAAAEMLGLAPGDPVLRLSRLRKLDGAEVYFVTKEFPLARFPEFETHYRPRQSVGDVFRAYGIDSYTRAENRITGGFADALEADAMEMSPRTPILRVEAYNVDEAGRPIEYSLGRWPFAGVELVVGPNRPEPPAQP